MNKDQEPPIVSQRPKIPEETERKPGWTRTGIRTPRKTIVIRPEERIDTDKMREGIDEVHAEMKALWKQGKETSRVSEEALNSLK